MKGIVLAAFAVMAAHAADQKSFDVASIRPAQPGQRGDGVQMEPGVVTLRNATLRSCIRFAYHVEDYQISGPSMLDEARFDIVAKAATAAPGDDLRLMMRSLLDERFKLAFHKEPREMTALVLVVAKGGHKLTPNEVEGKPSFQTGKLNLTGKGATLGQLTDFLSHELRQPVIDQTGLTGRFDFFLDINAYVNEEVMKTAGPNGGPPTEAPAIIAQAMQKQLGLKVEPRKLPIDVIVVDRMEKAPTEN